MDFLFSIVTFLAQYVPELVIGGIVGWWARKYVEKKNAALVARLDQAANEKIDQAKSKIENA